MRMTQIWEGDKVVPVTPVQAGPCFVVQVKNNDSDGYSALQLGFGARKEKNIKKPQKNHIAKSGVKSVMYLREFRVENLPEAKSGDVITAETFSKGETINVSGVSKGKGFAGVVRRHGFRGHKATHGNKDQERMPGSIGPKGPAHVFKGMKMGGRMGGDRVTTTNLEVVSVDEEKNIIFVKGAVPGAINGLIMITGKGDMQLNLKKEVALEVVETAEVTEVIEPTVEATPEAAATEEVKEEVKA